MDILGKLLMSAALKKAAALEQWLHNHRACGGPIAVDHSDDSCHVHVACACGALLDLTVVIDVIARCQAA